MGQITESWLQAHLCGPRDTDGIKVLSPMIELARGGRISAQASANHFCSPKSDYGPYTSVEIFAVDLPRDVQEMLADKFSVDRKTWGWVPVALVVEVINESGGPKQVA